MGKKKVHAMISEDERKELDLKKLYAIHLCLTDEVLREVVEEESMAGLWLKLESL